MLYTITVKRVDTGASVIPSAEIMDSLPAGFRYIDGTAKVGGVAIADPKGKPAPVLRFNVGSMKAGDTVTLTYRVRIAVGAMQGSGINRAQATAIPGAACTANAKPSLLCSNEAQYKVKVTGGVFSNEACVTGKVYMDCSNNHMQEGNETGIPGVRLFMNDGTNFTTDSEGKYSYCGLSPRTSVLTVDQTTLPRGAVMTTSSSRNVGDAMSIFLDLKNGDLQRADFVETSCYDTVLDQVKERKTRIDAGVNPIKGAPAKTLEFDSKPAATPATAK
jgi:Domain of unknown function DUF11